MTRDARMTSCQESRDYLQQLMTVDRAAAQFEINLDVIRDRGRRRQCRDVGRFGVDAANELVVIGPVSQGLDSTCCGAGPDRDEKSGLTTDLTNSLTVSRGGDRSFHQ